MRERQIAMDVRKAQSSSATQSKRLRFVGGLGEIKQEFKRISWTSKDELRTYTKIVVGAIFVVGIGTYLVDLVVRGSLTGLSHLVRAVVG